MKALILSAFAAGALTLGACATTSSSDSAATSGGAMVAEYAAVSQQMRDIDAMVWAADPRPARGSVVERQVLGRLEQLWNRREELRVALAARRQSLTADELAVLIAEIDWQLAPYDDRALAPSGVRAGVTRPLMRTVYTGGNALTLPDPNVGVIRLSPESTGMRHSEWRRIAGLKKEREALWAAMRTRAGSTKMESVIETQPPDLGG